MDYHPDKRKLLDTLLKNHCINAEQYLRCKKITRITPDKSDWRQFLDRFLFFAGISLLSLGILFFFAYNWQDLHKFTKFILIGSAILGSIALTHFKGTDSPGGKGGLLLASLLTGILLAVYGQTYQTGADPYGLFLGWAILILSWVWLARLQALWILFILLCNLALIMYWSEFMSTPITGGILFSGNPLFYRLTGISDIKLNELLVLFNSIGLIIWEFTLKKKTHHADSRWAIRLLATYIIISTSQIWFTVLFSYNYGLQYKSWGHVIFDASIYTIVLACIIMFYKNRGRDLYILAVSYFSVTFAVCALIGKGIGDAATSFLLLSFIAVGLTSAFTFSLKKTAREWRLEDGSG
ncbi:MAG: DUF2157 domain-containing protein [Gammaproteobacteria bacterium]|nr:DUF2157 domain-containing protein [Gammaproteobacteria bacterium]